MLVMTIQKSFNAHMSCNKNKPLLTNSNVIVNIHWYDTH